MSDKLYEFIKINDVPTLSEEYVGEIRTRNVNHTKKHIFNLANREQRNVLLDIIKRYGITIKDFNEQDKIEHRRFYKMLTNNLRDSVGLVYYYYNPELEYLDELNRSFDKEKYANGILLYNNNEVNAVDNVYRLTEKENEEDKTKGFFKETLKDFKNFFLSKRQGHDFKKDLEEILNAEDNAVEYRTISEGHYFKNEKNEKEKGIIPHTAKSPRIGFILNKTNLTEESKGKFKKYEDLKSFVENFNESEFDKNELTEFFKAVDKIVKNYALHQDLINQIEEVKKKISIA